MTNGQIKIPARLLFDNYFSYSIAACAAATRAMGTR